MFNKDDLNTLNVGDIAVISTSGCQHYTDVKVKRKTSTQLIVVYAHNEEVERKFRIKDGQEVGKDYYRSDTLRLLSQGILDYRARQSLERQAHPVIQRLQEKLAKVRWLTDDQIWEVVKFTNQTFPEPEKEQTSSNS